MWLSNEARVKARVGAAAAPGSRPAARNTLVIIAFIVVTGALLTVGPTRVLSQVVQLVKVDVAVVGKGFRVSKLTGRPVVNEKDEKIGEIDDFVITQNDRTLFAVIQVGGFLGVGSRLVVLPYGSLRISDNGRRIELPGGSREELKKLTEFKYLT